MKKGISPIISVVLVVISAFTVGMLLSYYLSIEPSRVEEVESIEDLSIGMAVIVEYKNSTELHMENIERIAKEVAGRYSYREWGPYWDCTKYAMDLTYALREHNYTAERIWGTYKCKEKPEYHEWVVVFLDGEEIQVEATRGYIISEDLYEKCYVFGHYRPVP